MKWTQSSPRQQDIRFGSLWIGASSRSRINTGRWLKLDGVSKRYITENWIVILAGRRCWAAREVARESRTSRYSVRGWMTCNRRLWINIRILCYHRHRPSAIFSCCRISRESTAKYTAVRMVLSVDCGRRGKHRTYVCIWLINVS